MVSALIILILVMVPLASVAAERLSLLCGGNGTVNNNDSTYQSNIALLATSLPNKVASSPQLFATATAGQAPDEVYALALCRGDITDGNLTACSACVAASFQDAQQECRHPRNSKGATVYYDDCLLALSDDDSFLIIRPPPDATASDRTPVQMWNTLNITGDPRLVADVQQLLTGTAQVAAATTRRFATATMESHSRASPMLYALAQCTPDLSAVDCTACLQHIISIMQASYSTSSVPVGGRILMLRCNFRFEAFKFYRGEAMSRISSSSSATSPPLPSASTNTSMISKPRGIAMFVAAPLAVAVAVFCFIFYHRRLRTGYRQGKVRLQRKRADKLPQENELVWEMESVLSEFSTFDFNQILQATNNFSQENKLGQGGFGPVYKGQFPEGMQVAVKRLASHSGQGFVEFKNEVQLIAKLQHRNLVRLLGCCSQEEEKILVYEYLPNKSLDFFIFDENRKALLDWNKRLPIIQGIAEGLLYLHKHSRLRVIHRDLKPSNILLDSEMNPKISDFGLAKIFSSDDTEVSTTRRVAGTYGYMSPEYASEGLFSIKSDVFSFGVLILEILSGKRNSGSHDFGDFINLLGYAWQLCEEGRWNELVDPSLLTMFHSEQIMRCMNIALLCVQENAVDRPTMLDVVAMLNSETMILAKPKHPPYFYARAANVEAHTTTVSCSINDVTLSIICAR